MKKALSVLLIAALCISACVWSTSASDSYPESAHDYENNCMQQWDYTYPEPAQALFITFSQQTYLEPYKTYQSVTADDPPEMRQDILRFGSYSEDGDWLYIYNADGTMCASESGDALAGQTICVTGNSFTIVLKSDAQRTAYGFSIDRITTQLPEGFAAVRYHMTDSTYYEIVPAGENITLGREFNMRQDGDRIIVGWKTADGREWFYKNVPEPDEDGVYITSSSVQTDLVAGSGAEYDVYPMDCKIALTKDEVFSFQNTSDTFDDGYYFTGKHYRRMFADWFATFAWTPVAPLAALFCAFFTLLWPTLSFAGSCCGFPITAMLQHYGKIDLLSGQGVSTVGELQPDAELVSTINFYNVQAAVCHPVNHVAVERGTDEYTKQLHALYETLESGTAVYFELYPHSQHPLQSIATGNAIDILTGGAHGILLTGAYTDSDGNHILIAWDNNSSAYPSGRCNILYIDPDFTEIYDDDYHWSGTPLDGFSWSDSFEQFDSFRTQGVSNPFAWHIRFFKYGFKALAQMFSVWRSRRAH